RPQRRKQPVGRGRAALGGSTPETRIPNPVLLARGKPLLDLVPVDRVPPRVDVIRAAVLVLEIVGVLPHVEADDRELAFHQRAVLVGGRDDVDLARLVLYQPRPARAEASDGGGGKFLLELI